MRRGSSKSIQYSHRRSILHKERDAGPVPFLVRAMECCETIYIGNGEVCAPFHQPSKQVDVPEGDDEVREGLVVVVRVRDRPFEM